MRVYAYPILVNFNSFGVTLDSLLELLDESLHRLLAVLKAENDHYFILIGYISHYVHLLLDFAGQPPAGKDIETVFSHDACTLYHLFPDLSRGF